MLEYGRMYTCERCGRKKFVKSENMDVPAGWGKCERKELCPTCIDLYHEMMNALFAPEVKRPINLED